MSTLVRNSDAPSRCSDSSDRSLAGAQRQRVHHAHVRPRSERCNAGRRRRTTDDDDSRDCSRLEQGSATSVPGVSTHVTLAQGFVQGHTELPRRYARTSSVRDVSFCVTLTPSRSPTQKYLTSIAAGQVQDVDGAALGNRTPDLFITRTTRVVQAGSPEVAKHRLNCDNRPSRFTTVHGRSYRHVSLSWHREASRALGSKLPTSRTPTRFRNLAPPHP